MKKILLVSSVFFNFVSVFAEFDFDKQAYDGDEAKEWLMPRRYAAQMRQNCNFILTQNITRLLEKLEKEDLSKQEQKALNIWLDLFEKMRCSDESLRDIDTYLFKAKEVNRN